MSLYHRDIGFPKGLQWPLGGRYRLTLSGHARLECKKDRYNPIRVPNVIDFDRSDVFEIEVDDGTIVKFAIRIRYDGRHDLALVLRPSEEGAFHVVTVWLNSRKDQHFTLDERKYARP